MSSPAESATPGPATETAARSPEEAAEALFNLAPSRPASPTDAAAAKALVQVYDGAAPADAAALA